MAHPDCPTALETSSSSFASNDSGGGFHHQHHQHPHCPSSLSSSSSSSDDENDDCCGRKSGSSSSSSLEDTLSLTCDESLTSSSCMSSSTSSSSIADDNESDASSSSDNDDDEIDDDNNIYESPHLLRRRLLPLAPSPIIAPQSSDLVATTNNVSTGPIHLLPYYEINNVSSSSSSSPSLLWRKHLRPSIRLLCFTLALAWMVYHQLSLSATVSADFHDVTDGGAGGAGGSEPVQPPVFSVGDVIPLKNNKKETQEWKNFFNRRAPKILQKLPTKSSSKQYTIRIRGNRVDLVKQSLDFHSNCPSVKEVQVEWTAGTATTAALPDNGSDHLNDRDKHNKHPQEMMTVLKKKSQMPRFLLGHKSGKVKPVGKTSTSAVFLLDEDLILSCQEIERAFREWRLDPSRLVGFYPFHHTATATAASASTSAHKKRARGLSEFQLRPVSRGGSYSMVSDRAVFIHSHLLRSIPLTTPKRECQQLGMSIIVSSMTSKPPVVVMSNPQTLQQTTNRSKSKTSRHVSDTCRRWIESIGAGDLPDQLATVVGLSHQHHQ